MLFIRQKEIYLFAKILISKTCIGIEKKTIGKEKSVGKLNISL